MVGCLMLGGVLSVAEAGESQDYAAQWQRLVAESRGLSTREKLVAVNLFFNQMRAVSDKELWQQQDYWALPDELLTKGAGDCEDFALAKYHTLLALGVPEHQLRLINGRLFNLSRTGIEAHMLLAYFPDAGEPLLLDNVNSKIQPLTARRDFVAKFAFNRQGVWRYRNQQWQASSLGNQYAKWSHYYGRYAAYGAARLGG